MTTIPLKVRISEKSGIQAYQFYFLNGTVAINHDEGAFDASAGEARYLRWIMFGNPGGTMKVEVLRGDTVIKTRNASTIPNSATAGDDRLKILVS